MEQFLMHERMSYIEFMIRWAISSSTDLTLESLESEAAKGPIELPAEDITEVVETLNAVFDCPIRLDSQWQIDIPELAKEINDCIS